MEFITILIFPILRSIAGWLQNAAADGKFEWFEWRKLIETILKIAVPAVFLALGTSLSEVEASAIITVLIILIDQIKIAQKKVRKHK